MTLPLPGAGALTAPLTPSEVRPRDQRRESIESAATQFESLLLTQLVKVMRSTVGEGGLFGDGAGSQMYAHLFDQSFADSMAAGGGLGMRSVLERSMLGPAAYDAQQRANLDVGDATTLGPFTPRTVGAILEARPAAGTDLDGRTGRLQDIARDMLGPNGQAPQWGRAGRLTTDDLASEFSTEGPDGVAVFNVADAAGFEDCYKCNLFAFELSRRAGYMVPLVGRTRGWGYMGPDGVTADAAAGQLQGNWGQVATGESAESLDSGIVSGERAFLLTGTSPGDRSGHVGVVERVHEVDYDESGRIERIVYDGWEGLTRGARRVSQRTWNRSGNSGGTNARNGFDRIEVIELERPPDGGPEERPTHAHAQPSFHDLPPERRPRSFSSRSDSDRP